MNRTNEHNWKALFLNGPPRCGKDTLAMLLVHKYGATHLKFATLLKHAVHVGIGIDHNTRLVLNTIEEYKDQPMDMFFGKTPREVYIAYSEQFMKPLFGKDIFGKIMRNKIAKERWFFNKAGLFVFSDCGFASELEPVIDWFRPENCMLAQIMRDERNFNHDSRGYVDPTQLTQGNLMKFKIIANNDSLEFLEMRAERLYKELVP